MARPLSGAWQPPGQRCEEVELKQDTTRMRAVATSSTGAAKAAGVSVTDLLTERLS